MCGIFGYTGLKNNATEIVFDGLKLLEYRGYDSWGIATLNQKSKIIFQKHTGKISSVNHKSSFINNKSNFAIGHTRWATHGGVNIKNSHPHFDCTGKIAVVHNGIIENYSEIKQNLIKKGHKFISETDTEVVSHLVEEFSKTLSFKESAQKAFSKIKGLNCFLFMNEKGELIAAKNGSPLAIGIGESENLISSDSNALLSFTNKIIFLNDQEIAQIKSNSIKITNLASNKVIHPKITKVNSINESYNIGKFKHFMLKEIHDQPTVLRNILHNTKQVTILAKVINKAKGTFFVACGSASYAALSGTYLFSTIAKKHVNYSIGSEFSYLEDYIHKNSLVIPISQSGETIDVIEPVNMAKKRGAKIAAIVNVKNSTLNRNSDLSCLLEAGTEKAVCATKSWTAMIANLILTAYALANDLKTGEKIIESAALEVENILKPSYQNSIKKLAKKLLKTKDIFVIGRGLSYATALEATLKLKEVAYIHSEGFAGGELKHGVIALIEKGTPCIVFAPNDETYDAIISNAIEIKARGGYIIGISSKNNIAFDYFLPVKDCRQGSIITNIIPIQLLAYYLAIFKKFDPDKPRNLAKSVTVK